MLSADRRQQQRDQLRDSIIETALHLASKGWEAVTMRAIGDHLGYTAAGLYHHFPSKDAVLDEISRRGHAMLLKEFQKVASRSPRKTLLAIAKAHVDMAYDHPEMYAAVAGIGVVYEKGSPPPESQLILDLVEQTVLAVLPKPSMLPDAFDLMWSSLTGIVHLCLSGQIPGGRKRAHQLSALSVEQFVDSWGRRRHC